ncbi:MAG TPA: serine--tRNA ligase [Acidimicrobiales bacterium]
MLDVKLLRDEIDEVRGALGRRHIDLTDLDRAAALDRDHRAALAEAERLRAEVRRLSGAVAEARRGGDAEAADRLATESRAVGAAQAPADAEAARLAAELRTVLLGIPNLPAEDAPDGAGPEANVVVRVSGPEPAWSDDQRLPHWEIGAARGWLDPERAVRMSGSMFNMFRGDGARLLRALTQLALDRHADAWEEIRPPTMVRTETMIATGHLPKFADEAYHLERDDLWAIPTAEVPLTSMHAGEVLDEAALPLRYTAYTPCFRREAGAAGRDTRGVLRTHEFDKVELMAYCTAAQAPDVHAEILARSESLLGELGLHFRVLDLCAGDLGFGSRRTFDLEVYAPGCEQWLEVSSVSWYGDFQARRAATRFKPAEGRGTEHPHTLNGSALAWPRVWAALVETHRHPDGTIGVPDAVRPYLRGATVL